MLTPKLRQKILTQIENHYQVNKDFIVESFKKNHKNSFTTLYFLVQRMEKEQAAIYSKIKVKSSKPLIDHKIVLSQSNFNVRNRLKGSPEVESSLK